jgi:DNA-directed RNA polymerase subunit RPC12/RpoP
MNYKCPKCKKSLFLNEIFFLKVAPVDSNNQKNHPLLLCPYCNGRIRRISSDRYAITLMLSLIIGLLSASLLSSGVSLFSSALLAVAAVNFLFELATIGQKRWADAESP